MPGKIAKFRSLVAQIEALFEAERQELAREVLPLLLSTRAGLQEIDRSLAAFSDEELDTMIERARHRASDLSEDEIAAIIAEGIRAVRAERRSS
jgi:thymidylate synthase ThyX